MEQAKQANPRRNMVLHIIFDTQETAGHARTVRFTDYKSVRIEATLDMRGVTSRATSPKGDVRVHPSRIMTIIHDNRHEIGC